MKILMVCLGNICRSPLAEGILKHKALAAGLDWQIDSAGTNNYNMGIAPHKFSRKVAMQNGIDICDKRARMFRATDFGIYDKIYAMASDIIKDMQYIAGESFDIAKVDLLLNELYPGENLDVPDPWYGPEPGFHDVFKLINSACDRVIEKLGGAVSQSATQMVHPTEK